MKIIYRIAIQVQSKELINDVNYPLVQYNLGMIEYDYGDKIKAIEYFTSAINNTNSEVFDFDYFEILIKTLNEIKEYKKAFKNIETVLLLWNKNSSEYKYALILKATIYGSMNQFKKAIKEIDNVIDSGIENQDILFDAYAYQMEYYSKIKKSKKVCTIYQKIKNLKPKAKILNEYDCKK